jgi:hypothetical protein
VSATGAQAAELAEARQRRAAAGRAPPRLAKLAAAPSPPQRLRHLKVVPS